MNNESDDYENDRDEEKNDHRRQQNAPYRILQSHQRHERFDQWPQRHGQERAQRQTHERENHSNRPFSITQRAEQGEQQHSHNPDCHAHNIVLSRPKST